MIFSSIRIQNYRSIVDTGVIPLGPITILVGRNNSGKSALLYALYMLQSGSPSEASDVRIGSDELRVDVDLGSWAKFYTTPTEPLPLEATRVYAYGSNQITLRATEPVGTLGDQPSALNHSVVRQASNQEPHNLIYPAFSGRRPQTYQEQVRAAAAKSIGPTDANIVSRVLALSTSDIPEAVRLKKLSNEILGLNLNVMTNRHDQQQLGLQVDRFSEIPIDSMGTGIRSVLSLLVGLSCADKKLFLIEEPENDLHPQALKVLLEAIVEASDNNQFIISTHSSVVLTKLGAVEDAVVLHTTSDGQVPPRSSYEIIETPTARVGILQDLGYELADLGLSEGWLIFEESSAERLVREFFIKWYAPGLARLRTLAATGISRLAPLVQDFHELFLFAHVEPLYRDRAWIIADGDPAGMQVISQLGARFPSWPSGHFQNFPKSDFEEYYPDRFQPAVKAALEMRDKSGKKVAKREVLLNVLNWIAEDEDAARAEFEVSASEVIRTLRNIEVQLLEMRRIG